MTTSQVVFVTDGFVQWLLTSPHIVTADDEATHENTLKARETRSPVITESKSPLGAGVDVPRQAEPMDTDENELDVSQKFALLGNVGEYDWLVESFRHLHDV